MFSISKFPYLPPKSSEPTKTLKSLVNIRKESVKFVKAEGEEKGSYNIEVSLIIILKNSQQKQTKKLEFFIFSIPVCV